MVGISRIDIKEKGPKVIFLPYYDYNPYQTELANSLSKEGVDVRFGTELSLFSLLKSDKNCWKPNILHLHWAQLFILDTTIPKTLITSIRFMSKLVTGRLLGIKIVWTVHNIVSHEARFPRLELLLNRILAKICDKVVVHSSSSKDEVIKKYKVKESIIRIIPHGNYIDSYKNILTTSQAREHLQLGETEVVFVYFGAVRAYKGIPELIEAFKKLNAPEKRLFIVGKPSDTRIENEIRDKCGMDTNIKLIFEFIPDNDVQIYMNGADIIVLPFRDILTSGSVILAMSFGKAIIAPRIGCIPDILDNKGGILYNHSEKNGLLEAMNEALNRDLKRMGKHNYELVKKLSWEKIGKQTSYIYKECYKRADMMF